ncbi:2-phospho-L-lactate guanylyltransferase [Gordonia sp. NPDC003429]
MTDVVAVLAVKDLRDAKTRLAVIPGPPSGRAELVLAMLADTIAALLAAGVDRIVVVSPDETVRELAARAGARPIPEDISGGGLNAAYAQGAAHARALWPVAGMALMIQADLPAAAPHSLRQIIEAAAPDTQSIVADRSGAGTALLLRPIAIDELPRFGTDSAAAHRNGGATELDPQGTRWPDVRTDVDTVDDLRAAMRLGVGPRTRIAAISVAGAGRPGAATGVGTQADAS